MEQLTAQLSLKASYLRCISSLCAYKTWKERHQYQNDITPKGAKNPSLLSSCLTLRTVISSSASAVVSSSSVLACCSWLSRAWRAAWRLVIWDSRSCIDRVNSVTWRLISSFSSSCSSPIYIGKQWAMCDMEDHWKSVLLFLSYTQQHVNLTMHSTSMWQQQNQLSKKIFHSFNLQHTIKN